MRCIRIYIFGSIIICHGILTWINVNRFEVLTYLNFMVHSFLFSLLWIMVYWYSIRDANFRKKCSRVCRVIAAFTFAFAFAQPTLIAYNIIFHLFVCRCVPPWILIYKSCKMIAAPNDKDNKRLSTENNSPQKQ